MSSDTVLCKYMPYKFFSKMLEESALTLVDPFLCWEDAYEGAFYRAIEDKETFDYLVSITHHRDKNTEENDRLKRFLIKVKNVKAQSWTKTCDDLLMWAAYSYDKKSIMIQTSSDKMNAVCKGNYESSGEMLSLPWIHEILYDYDNESVIRSDIALSFGAITGMLINPFEPFMHKRQELSYEQEVRHFALDLTEDGRKTARLKINDIQMFVDGVMVHPGASKQFTGKVRNTCEEYGIRFLGKSKKYNISFLKVLSEEQETPI